MSTTKQLLFKNPVFNHGKNITIRRGVKWDLESKALIAGRGVVPIKTKVMHFSSIPASDHMYNHEPLARSYAGCLKIMAATYKGFSPLEVVTVVEFILP